MVERHKHFGDVSQEFRDPKKSHYVVLPVSYERTTTYITGCGAGPQAIIQASLQVELYDEETGAEPFRQGIHTHREPPFAGHRSDERAALNEIKKTAAALIKSGKFVIALGGEHTVSVPIIQAHAEADQGAITALILDAHADLRDSYMDSKFNHACTCRRILDFARIVQVGVRSYSIEEAEFIKKTPEEKLKIVHANDICRSDGWIKEIVDDLKGRVYISVDLDVFDPSVIPSAGTPEPGGLGWYDVTGLLKEVFLKKHVIGCDIVELCPRPAHIRSDFTAARLAYKMMAYQSMKCEV